MLQALPTASKLVRWKRTTEASRPLCSCGIVQTNKHVLSNYSSATARHRYTTRHNDVLNLLIGLLKVVLPRDKLLYADVDDAAVLPVCNLFRNIRQNIAILEGRSSWCDNEILTLE